MKQSVKLVAGNWKMHGLSSSLEEAWRLRSALEAEPASCRTALFPPATLIDRMASVLAGGSVELGGQDCHDKPAGAFTGSVSAEMLADAGAQMVILGHSERRTLLGETCGLVRDKVLAAIAAGLEPIVCIGESLEQREAGDAVAVVTAMIENSLPLEIAERRFSVAYEPIWAIGTGHTPTLGQIHDVHAAIRQAVVRRLGQAAGHVPILYGGSVKPDNAQAIMATPEVGGVLVGGASLRADDFLAIVRAA